MSSASKLAADQPSCWPGGQVRPAGQVGGMFLRKMNPWRGKSLPLLLLEERERERERELEEELLGAYVRTYVRI